MIDLEKATALIAKHEGFRATAYKDTRGFLTIGYGTNLDAEGAADHCIAVGLDYAALREGAAMTEEQASELLTEAARHAMDMGLVTVVGLLDMPEPVQLVVVDMIYNLGREGFLKFRRMRDALERHDYAGAAVEMRNSAWFQQVGTRAIDDIGLMTGAAG